VNFKRLMVFIVGAALTASAQQLVVGRESIPGADTFRSTVMTPDGYPLEVFLTRPKDKAGKIPVLFEVAWLSCDSVEEPKLDDGWTQLMWDLAARSGLATFRVNKPGVGGSEGPKCVDLDWQTELKAYRAAFDATNEFNFLDTSRVYIVGFSNGGGVAPLVAGGPAVRGYVVFSGWYKTWLEHMLEHERRRMRLSGIAPSEISRRMKQYATFYDLYLNGELTPAQVLDKFPEFKDIWYDQPEHQYGRPASFFQQLQGLNLAEAWDQVKVPVLAVHGEYDWIMSSDDYRLLVNELNSRHSGIAEYIEWPHADHLLYTHASEQDAFHHDPNQKYDPKLTDTVLEWLKKH